MGVKVVRKSGRKDWYIQVCEGGRRYLRHVGSREAAYAAKKEIEEALAVRAFVPPKDEILREVLSFITPEIAADALQRALKAAHPPGMPCEVCFATGARIMDGHHLFPKFEAKRLGMLNKEKIRIDANCHAVAHRKWGQSGSYDGPTNREDFIVALRALRMAGN